MSLPWKRAAPGKAARKREEAQAKREGGRRVAGSGSQREKGDWVANGERIEDKSTRAWSYRIGMDVLAKIEHEAIHTPPGFIPVLRVTMAEGTPLERTVRIYREEDCG